MSSKMKENDSITFDSSVEDMDTVLGQVLRVSWTSNVSGEFINYTFYDQTSSNYSGLDPGWHTIRVMVFDGELSSFAETVIFIEPVQESEEIPETTNLIIIVVIIACALVGIAIIAHLIRRSRL